MIKSNPLDDFLDYMRSTKNSSENTIKEYYYDIRLFLRYIMIRKNIVNSNIDFNDIEIDDIDIDILNSVEKQDIYSFNSYLVKNRKLSSRSLHRKISAVRSFYHYLVNKVDLVAKNPLEYIDMPKIGKTLPVYLTYDEAINLLKTVENEDIMSKYKTRDYAIITLFLNCGMRLSELTSIDIKDIKKDNTITIVGKGNKERTIYLNNACVYAIKNYLKNRPKVDNNALFLSMRGNRMSNRSIQHMIEKYIIKSGLDPKKYSVHKLRHTAATLMYQYGNADIRSLQEILGHDSVNTTEIYTHVNKRQLKNTVENNPLSKIFDDNFEDKK